MARILISESHEDVRRLLVRMLTRLGHEPIVVKVPAPEHLLSAEAMIVEAAEPIGVVLAQTACLVNPSLPLICASVAGPPAELAELGVVFAASLVKPFTAAQLAAAIEQSLRSRQRDHGRPARYRGYRAA
jgi:DNA-binding NtrC family response regulator